MYLSRRRLILQIQTEPLEKRILFSAPYVIDGVQPAALDQPQIHAYLTRSANGAPITASAGGVSSFDIQAFLDTGTSEVLLSQETAQALGINAEMVNGQPVVFTDVGVAGGQTSDVSEPLYTALAPFTATADVDNPATYQSVYTEQFGPLRAEMTTTPADDLIGPLDIFGMPVLQGKVMVMDPKPVQDPNNPGNMNTYVYDPGTPYNASAADSNPGIVPTMYHVKLSSASFARFTSLSPSNAAGPTIDANPFIGPDPTAQLNPGATPDNTPPVTISQGAFSGTGSFLFDTGSASSFISQAEANSVHVHYKAGTYNSSNPVLVDDNGNPLPNQFVEQVGGIGGSINAAGFFLDSLTLQTVEGQPITFTHAPVLVTDVTATDPVTNQSITLDGDFGMNYLVASTNVSNGSFGTTNSSPWDWATYDQANGLLGLQPAGMAVQAKLNNMVQGTPGKTNTIILRHEATGNLIDVWVNAPETGAPTQMANGALPIFVASGGKTDGLVLDTANGSPIGTKLILHGSFNTGALTIGAGQTVALDQSTGGTSTLAVTALSINSTGTLDLANNSLLLPYYATNDLSASIRQLIVAGRNGGNWQGHGITSSDASLSPGKFGVGWVDQTSSHLVTIRGTWLGDANLDGKVNVTDLGILSTNFGKKSGEVWAQGDFNYDGAVNVTDLGLLATNFGKSVSPAAAAVSAFTASVRPTHTVAPVVRHRALPAPVTSPARKSSAARALHLRGTRRLSLMTTLPSMVVKSAII